MAILLSLIAEKRVTVGKSFTSKVDYGGTTPLLHCLSQTTFIKGPAGEWKRMTMCRYLIQKCAHLCIRPHTVREQEREKEEYDVMFVYLKIDFFALISQWSRHCLL